MHNSFTKVVMRVKVAIKNPSKSLVANLILSDKNSSY